MIPTAEDLFNEYNIYTIGGNKQKVIPLMIEFAKLHVQEALEQASEKANPIQNLITGYCRIDETSIINAYPLENIK